MSQSNPQPYPAQGDFLPVPTQEQLISLLRVAPTDPANSSKRSKPLPLFLPLVEAQTRRALEEVFRLKPSPPFLDRLRGRTKAP